MLVKMAMKCVVTGSKTLHILLDHGQNISWKHLEVISADLLNTRN